MNHDLIAFRNAVRSLLTEVTIAILSRDLQGNLVLHMGLESVFGYPIERFKEDPNFFMHLVTERSNSTASWCLSDPWWSLNVSQGQPFDTEVEILHGDGKMHWMRYHVRPVFDESGNLVRHDAIIFDRSREKSEEKELGQSEARFQMLVENLPDGIILTQDGSIQYANPTAITLWEGESDKDIIFPQESLLLNDQDFVTSATKQWCERNNGTRFLGEVVHCRVEFNQRPAVMSIIRDRTEQFFLQQELERMAYEDSVTGLSNRRKFYEMLSTLMKESLAKDQQVAVVYLDLDRFKIINDEYGHSFGDDVLKAVAQRLQASHQYSSLIARLGGDEFAFLYHHTSQTEVSLAAQGILGQFHKPLNIHGTFLKIAPSLGVAFYPQDASTLDELMRYADRAMYESKKSGGNRVVFYEKTF